MTKLCPRGKAAAKRKFKVYPSAYANAYASKICAGKIKDPSGVKRKDFRGPKPAATGGMMKNDKKNKQQADPAKLIKKRKDSKKEALERMKKELGMRKGAMMTAGSRSALGRIQKANMVGARMGKAVDYQKYLKGLKKATGKAPVKGGTLGISAKTLDKQLMKTKNPYSDFKKTTEAGPKNYKRLSSSSEFLKRRKALGSRAIAAAKATRIGKIAAGVAALGLAGKAALEKAYEKRTGKKPLTKRRKLVDKKSKGGLKAELNNPAKGYTKGGMADYYKDLM